MSFKDRMVSTGARGALYLLRAMILYLPDRALGKIFRAVERLVYAATGSRDIAMPVAEIADIFESGPPFTTTVRKLFKERSTEWGLSSAVCLARKSPYGAA